MNVEEAADGTLVVTYDGRGLTRLMLAATALLVAVAGYDVVAGARGTERLIGLLASAATCFVVAIVFHETARFEFSRPTHLVTWRRRWGFLKRSGTVPFGAIQSVMVERPLGDDGAPSRRINLRMVNGAAIPLTVGYQSDVDGAILKVADRIRAVLGHNAQETRSADVSTLVAAGKMIEAIKVLRETEGLTLTDAKQRVDDLRRKASSR